MVPPREEVLRSLARQVIDAGWFDGMSDEARVAGLLGRAYPVSAAALQVLPRLIARIGQNVNKRPTGTPLEFGLPH